jgi:hypothetical protein
VVGYAEDSGAEFLKCERGCSSGMLWVPGHTVEMVKEILEEPQYRTHSPFEYTNEQMRGVNEMLLQRR